MLPRNQLPNNVCKTGLLNHFKKECDNDETETTKIEYHKHVFNNRPTVTGLKKVKLR